MIQSSKIGVGFVTEDRRGEGLILGLKSLSNMTLRCLDNISRFFVINRKLENKIGLDYVKKMNMKSEYLYLNANSLSGVGIRQKVVVARQLASDSNIIIFDEAY